MQWLTRDTLTNAAYFIAGMVAGAQTDTAGMVFIAAMVYLTVGSTLAHAGERGGWHLDVASMYTVGLVIWLYTILNGYQTDSNVVGGAVLMVSALGGFALRMKQLDVPMEAKIGALYGVTLATAFLFHGFTVPLLASTGVLTAALVIRFYWTAVTADGVRGPHRYSHGVWHILAAVSLALLWTGVIA